MKMQREYPRLIITQKGTRWVESGHPWIYEAEVADTEGIIENGCLADAVSEKGKYLGTGFVSRESNAKSSLSDSRRKRMTGELKSVYPIS